MDKKAGDIKRYLETLRKRRRHFEDTWEQIDEYITPRRSRNWHKNQGSEKGRRYGESIYDTTAIYASQVATDGTQGHMVSPSFRWLQLIMRDTDDDHEVLDWLQECTDHIYLAINDTNFYESINEFIYDGWTRGTACLYIEEDVARQRPTFRAINMYEVFIAENAGGEVTTVYREFTLTAEQAVGEFGEYHKDVVRLAKENPAENVNFIHAVQPRYTRDPKKQDSQNMPFESCYVDVDRGIVIREGGYRRMPYSVWRFRKNSDEEYGRSPGWDALREIKILNEMVKAATTMVQMSAKPIRYVPEKYVDKWQFIAGAINGYKDPGAIGQKENQDNSLVYLLQFINELREAIRKHYQVDFWQMLQMRSDQSKTATEVIELQNEKLAIMTSSIGRLTKEALQTATENVFDIEYYGGRLPQLPEALQTEEEGESRKLDVDFVGPLNQAIKRLGTQGTQQAFMQIVQYAQVDPAVLRRFKLPEAAVMIAKSYGMDMDLIRDDEEMAELAQQEQNQQQMAMQQQAQAEALRGADPNTAPQQGSILSQIMGG